jgi:hypothetical protein
MEEEDQKDWPFFVVNCDECGAAARYVHPDSGTPFILCTGDASHDFRVPPGMRPPLRDATDMPQRRKRSADAAG